MNDTSNNERNEQMVKIMAVIGFVVLVCLLAWLAVQVVRFIPTAFSSLANIFEANQREYAENTDDENEVIVVVNEEAEEEPEEEEDSEEETVATSTTPVATSTVATRPTSKPKPAPVQYRTVTTYKYPVSDPNGQIDLAATFVGVGTLNSSGKFVVGELSDNGQGAMQFVVKNIGTKTSGTWSFEATMPNGSKTSSKTQQPLRPAESSTLTLVFGMNDENPHDVSAIVTASGDVNTKNNAFGAKLVQR